MNKAKTWLLLAGLTGVFLLVGYALGGAGGMMIALIAAGTMNFLAYWNADKLMLRMYGAREIGLEDAPEFHGLVADLARRARLPMPRVFVIDSDQPNAFATGRNPENAAVAATQGLLRHLTREEIAGVMAHELAHIKNRDTLIMTVTAMIAGAIGMLANVAFFFRGGRDSPLGAMGVIAGALLAPLAAMLVQMAISRTREYEADRIGAEIAGRPLWLASALEKIDGLARRIDNNPAERNPATAHLFIINPLHAHAVDGLFSTHPRTESRVARLRDMAADETAGRRTSVPSVGGR